MRRKVSFVIMSLIAIVAFSQETVAPSVETAQTDTENSTSTKFQSTNIFLQMGPVLTIDAEENGAPSPLLYSIGGGYELPIKPWLSFVPQGRFYIATYLWDDSLEMALPAEIERRMATVPSLLIDLPANFHFVKNSFIIGIQPGLSFLFRYGFAASDVDDKDTEISNINKWFYSSARFIYPSLRVSVDKTLSSGLKIGISIAEYFPIGSIIDGTMPQELISSLSFRLFIPKARTQLEK